MSSLLEWLAGHSTGPVLRSARVVTTLGDTPVVWTAVTASALLAATRSRHWASVAGPLATLAATAGVRRILAEVIDRPRPPRRLWRTDWSGPSCPSRHTTLATMGAGLVAGTLAPDRRDAVRPLVWSVAAGVGASRLVLGVHWPTDVLAGWAFAAAWLNLARTLHSGPTSRAAKER